jgi:hypothetical protein
LILNLGREAVMQEKSAAKRVFSVMFNMEDVGVYENFTDAFKDFWARIMADLDSGTSWQALESFHFIIQIEGKSHIPMGYYDARDLAYDIGLLAPNGEDRPTLLDAPTVENWEELVEAKYLSVIVEYVGSLDRDLDTVLAQLKELADAQGDPELSAHIESMMGKFETVRMGVKPE